RFFREAQAAGRLNHPNIVTVYDVGEERDLAYIAMDRLTGEALNDRLQRQPAAPLSQLCEWMAQAADALDFAHRNDIIHRDIKPANLYIDETANRLTVTDFGVARITGMHQTQTGVVLGSPSFMSPEQIRGESLTGATDIFSLGVTFYQALCGQLPFSGDTLPGLAYAITQTQQESPRKHNPEVPVALVRIVNKALKKNPDERYGSAGEMAQALRKWSSAAE
ncbi:serine/threonine protein kinase, partial [bacterium]|nr:serine/threonine protein kinase [bacterium]